MLSSSKLRLLTNRGNGGNVIVLAAENRDDENVNDYRSDGKQDAKATSADGPQRKSSRQ